MRIRSQRQVFARWVVIVVTLACFATTGRDSAAQTPRVGQKPLMKWQVMEQVARRHLQSRPPKRYAKLVVLEDIVPLLDEIERVGWALPYRDELSKRMLRQSDFLAQFANSVAGAKYLDQMGGDPLALDRVERVSQARGGQRALTDLAKLPNAAKIGTSNSKSFMPSLKDMLPIRGGKRPVIKDYDKPTGRAYTEQQVIEAMAALHQAAERERQGR